MYKHHKIDICINKDFIIHLSLLFYFICFILFYFISSVLVYSILKINNYNSKIDHCNFINLI